MTVLHQYKNQIQELARPTRFIVSFPSVPTGVSINANSIYTIKNAQLPGRTVQEIVTNWFGEELKFNGDPVYEAMQITFLNRESFAERIQFERWLDLLASVKDNIRGGINDFKGTIKIQQFSGKNTVIGTYYAHGAFPMSVSAIELSQDGKNMVEEFTVSFSIDKFGNDISEINSVGTVKL